MAKEESYSNDVAFITPDKIVKWMNFSVKLPSYNTTSPVRENPWTINAVHKIV